MAKMLYSVATCDDVADKIVNSLTGVGISPNQITLLRRLKAHKDCAKVNSSFRCVTSGHDDYFQASGMSVNESRPYREALEEGRIVIALSFGISGQASAPVIDKGSSEPKPSYEPALLQTA
ncbi:hypothetical protein GCM10022278_26370 [Allohahella marinimesophila]|uniref:Uncharacterized protein n=1 Tax=Allohahella marinimesophila TaxID=1054972 RepID=A0ABP7PKM6_9GAMM